LKKSILFCVATEKGFEVLKAAHKLLKIEINVSTFREVKVTNSFDEKIKLFAKNNELPIHKWEDIRKGGLEWLRENRIWAVVCVGWKYMIFKKSIDYLDGRVLIAHDSLLPKYRGFSPLASALINGEDEVGLTVIFAGSEMDTGDIVFQKKISIFSNDTIGDLIKKITPLFIEGVVSSLEKMISGKITSKKQDHSKATHSIWRDETDLWLDWNESASRIERTIRALSRPYMGVRTKLGSEEVTIHKAEVIPDIFFEIRQPGKVWKLTNEGKPIVVCGKGMLLIIEASLGKKSLLPMKRMRVQFQ
jgi:methionyl-tRNA formyltransferase